LNTRPDHFDIPELCNTTALAFLILFTQLLVVVMLFAGGELSWLRFGLMSLFVQWVSLASAGLLCALRKVLDRVGLLTGASAAYAIVLVVTLIVSLVAESILDRGPGALVRIASQVTIAGIVAGLVLRYFYLQQRLRLQEQSELQSRIQALQSRIRPHFLFNSMNIIASLIATDPETAESVVEDLSELFRASLNDAGNQVSIEEELDLCERYIRIEALRLGDRLRFDWDIETTSGPVRIPLLTLQPLLENAIYHGIQPLPEGGTITVSLGYVDDLVKITITNPLPEPARHSEGEGNRMALQNIRNRLAVLYGDRADLSAEGHDGTFVTSLRFPKMPQTV
jgi:two-component system sensor histidine kinase AlgZ